MVLRWVHVLRRRPFLLCAMSGLLLALSFPFYLFGFSFRLGFIAYFSLVPFLFSLVDREHEPSFSLGFLTGLIFYGVSLFWVAWATLPGGIGSIVFLALYLGLFTLILTFLYERWGSIVLWLFPLFWTAMEYLRSIGQLAFPWTSICYSQSEYLHLIQFTSLVGPYGVSLWLAIINVLIFFALKNWRRQKYLLLLLAPLFLVPYIHGLKTIPENELSPEFKVALIQPNVDPHVKWDTQFIEHNFDVLLNLTRQLEIEDLDLVIWPETATPCYLVRQRKHYQKVRDLVDEIQVSLLTGSPDYAYIDEEEYQYFNSAFFFVPNDQEIQRYSKMRLVPFSEKIPYDEHIGLLDRINFGQADFTPGHDWTIFEHPRGRFAVLICFESVFPQMAREFHRLGADFLVVITNDGWFGPTSGPFQHAQIAVFRAIENRISIARCANTGVSMVIDPYGRIKLQTPIYVERALTAEVSMQNQSTFYNRHGEWLSWICCGITGLFLFGALFRKKREMVS